MKNVLNYFVRKAFGFKSTATAEDKTLFGHLLRIRQNIQGVYDWLYGRLSGSVDGTVPKRMPMTEAVVDPNGNMGAEPLRLRPVLQNSDNLLAHLRLLDNRKITNGYADGTPADDGLPDGVSLARILCDSTTQPTELIDDNIGWVMDKMPPWSSLASITKASFNTTSLTISDYKQPLVTNKTNLNELELPALEKVSVLDNKGSTGWGIISQVPLKRLHLPSLKEYYTDYHSSSYEGMIWDCAELEEFIAPNLTKLNLSNYPNHENAMLVKCLALKKIVLGKIEYIRNGKSQNATGDAITGGGVCPNLLHLEIGEGTAVSLMISNWSPTLDSSNLSLFLDNFLHFIAERVAEGNYTLTLSAAVYAALEQQEGQTILALLNTKGWTVASA